jgi:hypothetical protein
MPETVPTPDEVVADTSALAANSAERAQAAAHDAIVTAEQAAAGLAVVAAEESRQSEERLATWQSSLQQQHEKLSSDVTQQNEQMRAQLAEALDRISSIQSRLETQPASRESPPAGESGEPIHDPPAGETPPAEPKPAERRRAHRWI